MVLYLSDTQGLTNRCRFDRLKALSGVEGQLTAGRSDASHSIMKMPPFQSTLAPRRRWLSSFSLGLLFT
jgi:hypothetical protein